MTIATTGNIAITTTPAYCSEDEWRNKTGISETDESSSQFVIDSREAHFFIRRCCMHLVRERIVYKRDDNKAYLPIRWLSDGNMDGTVDADDILIYELADDGISLNTVDKDTYLDSVNNFNNFITFTDDYTPTSQILVTYFALGKPLDEVSVDELKRATIAQITILVIERLRRKWGLKGTTSWSVPGVNVNKDLSSYEELYNEAKKVSLDNCRAYNTALGLKTSGGGMYCHHISPTGSQWGFITEEHYKTLQRFANGLAFNREYDDLKQEYDDLKQEWYATRAYFNNTHDNMTDVWNYPRAKGSDRCGHPTPKPVNMMARIIKSSSREGDIVIDPLMGEGPVCRAAKQLKRNYIACEIDEKYCQVGVQRLAQEELF